MTFNYLKKVKSLISPHNKSEKIVTNLLTLLKKETKNNPQLHLKSVLTHITPGLKLVPRVKSGRVIYYPTYMTQYNSYYYSIKWLLNGLKETNKKIPFYERLVSICLETLENKGLAYKAKTTLLESLLDSRTLLRRRTFKPKKKLKIKKKVIETITEKKPKRKKIYRLKNNITK